MTEPGERSVATPRRRGRLFPLLFPVGATFVSAVLIVAGQAVVAALVLAVLVAYLQARRASPSFARVADRRLARFAEVFGRGAATVVSWLLLGTLFLLVFLPLWLLTASFLSSASRRRWRRDGVGWVEGSRLRHARSPRRTFGRERVRVPAPLGVTLTRVAAVVAVLVVLDVVAGSLLTATGVLPHDRGDVRDQVTAAVEVIMSAPPIVDEPWAEQYGEDLTRFELGGDDYVPFLVRGPRPFDGEDLNTTDRERVSYVPEPTEGTEPIRIGFFGGSVLFGVGQRDEHTIPSEVARLAEAAGVEVEVQNFGFPGWVAWQEQQYLERMLAGGEALDLVVFYDGFNEFLAQNTYPSPDPTHVGADVLDDLAGDWHEANEEPDGPWDGVRAVWDAYTDNSALAIAANEVVGDDEPIPAPVDPEAQAAAALDVYARAKAMAEEVAAAHGTATRFFWQPRQGGWPQEVLEALPPGVTDVSGVFDGIEEQVYIDEVHTNEPGARLAAEAVWETLRPEVERLAGR